MRRLGVFHGRGKRGDGIPTKGKPVMKDLLLIWLIAVCLLGGDAAGGDGVPAAYDENALREEFYAFVASLDVMAVSRGYPKAVEKLLSGDPEKQVEAVKTLAETGEMEVIPWLLPFLEADDRHVAISAALSLEKLVSTYVLKRRDMSEPGGVLIKPLGCGDRDLRPLAWIVLKMFRRPDDGSTHAYAATMTRYLELHEFEGELRQRLESRHPAVSNKAKWALAALARQQAYKAGRSGSPLAIAELGRATGPETVYLPNDYGFLIYWLDHQEPELYLYDRPAHRIEMTRNFKMFLTGLPVFQRAPRWTGYGVVRLAPWVCRRNATRS